MVGLAGRDFMVSTRCIEMADLTTGLVSRDKLMEFKADAREAVRRGTKEGGDAGGNKNKGGNIIGRFFSSKYPLRMWALSLR